MAKKNKKTKGKKDKNQSTFTDTLKQLFSTNISITVKDGSKYKLKSNYDSKDDENDSITSNDNKISTMLYSNNSYFDNINNYASSTGNKQELEFKTRLMRYNEYDEMDKDPIISSALDIYADEITSKGDTNELLTINSDSDEIKEALYLLYYKILDIDKNMWGWVRNAIKRGDHTLIINVTEDYGITNFYDVSPYRIERIEDYKKHGKETKFKIDGSNKKILNKYEIAHFRLISEHNNFPYGTSILRGVISQWQSLKLMEDAMLINWVTRAPERRIFKIDVGNLKPEDAKLHINAVKNSIKKTPVIDPKTGKYNLKFNVKNMLDDFFVTKRGNKYGTEIETLPGLSGLDIDNVEFQQNKVFAGLKIPKSFLSYADNENSKITVASEDDRFSKTIERLQNTTFLPTLYDLGKLHLFALGVDEKLINDFEINLNNPSLIREQLKLDLLATKLSLIRDVKESNMFDTKWAYEHIFNVSNKEANKLLKGVMNDKYTEYRFEQMESEGIVTDKKPSKTPEEVEESNNTLKQKINEIYMRTNKSKNIGMYSSYKLWLNEKNKTITEEKDK